VRRELHIGLVIITCPGREKLLKQTVESMQATDLLRGHATCFIQRDETTFERRQERQEHNSLAALKRMVETPLRPDLILFCEDDIVFNPHLRHNLERWSPLRNHQRNTPGQPKPSLREYFFGSLYDPTIRELSAHPEEHYFIADPEAVYGSQAFVMSRAMAEYFVAHWWEVPGMQDIKMSRLAARLGPIHYHMPSLVQHVGVVSTWTDDARFHDTKSFDGEWRAGSQK